MVPGAAGSRTGEVTVALYSVWDWNKNAWRIYATKKSVSVGDDPKPPAPTGISPIGADPDTDVRPLPFGAKFVGMSHLAKGEVRRLGSGGLGEASEDSFWSNPIVLIGLGAVAATVYWQWWRRAS
jgi:hypothetical protein